MYLTEADTYTFFSHGDFARGQRQIPVAAITVGTFASTDG